MSKIGFNLSHDTDDPSATDLDELLRNDEPLVNELIAGILNPPEWQVDYEQTLFWAVLFSTHHKVNQC
jgi:hypothetical protein